MSVIRRRRPADPDRPLSHVHRPDGPGPRVPACWGSWATEVCRCGAYRELLHSGPGRWLRGPVPTDARRDET
jgi:hypothetical protein